MEELALALTMLYNVEHGLNTSDFYALSRLVRERAGHTIPSNRPVVGERLFEVESGIIAGWYQRVHRGVPDRALPVSLGRGRPAPGPRSSTERAAVFPR